MGQLHETMYPEYYSLKKEKAYVYLHCRFIYFYHIRQSQEIGDSKIYSFIGKVSLCDYLPKIGQLLATLEKSSDRFWHLIEHQ